MADQGECTCRAVGTLPPGWRNVLDPACPVHGIPSRRYTLDEARRELARRECAADGHAWDVVTGSGARPILLFCDRCHRSWSVGQEKSGEDRP